MPFTVSIRMEFHLHTEEGGKFSHQCLFRVLFTFSLIAIVIYSVYHMNIMYAKVTYSINTTVSLNNILRKEEIEFKTLKKNSREVPSLIIQYGKPRTATTLQFQILCLMMAYIHEDELNNVTCFYNNGKRLKYNVIKTHKISNFLNERPSNTWIFLTSSKRLSNRKRLKFIKSIQLIKQKNFTIPYVADVSLLSKRGHFIVYEYQSIFGLSDAKMTQVAEYFRYWTILRVCCGMQMSADWRNHLAQSKNYTQHHDPHSSAYPACEIYNIGEVEKCMINTHAFKKLSNTDSLRRLIGKPRISDIVLDGTYCSRCNENIVKRNLKFNQNCG